MTPEQIEQIIEMLSEKLGPLGEVVWAVYMRQVYIDVLGGFLWMASLLVAAFVCWRFARKCQGIKDSMDRELGTLCAYFGFVCCLLLAFCALIFDVLKVLNPEYHAIQMLLGR